MTVSRLLTSVPQPSLRLSLLVLAWMLVSPLAKANWPAWRGPTSDGVVADAPLPLTWSRESSNIRWKTPLPDRGNSTPIVWGDRVFLTQAVETTGARNLLCLSVKTGDLLWTAGGVAPEREPTRATTPYAAASPVTDGIRVVAFFGSAGLHCYDFAGRVLWKRTDLGRQRHIWGSSASPVISHGRIYLSFGPGTDTRLICLDIASGQTLWEQREPGGHSGEGSTLKWRGSWGDPLIMTTASRQPQVLIAWPDRIRSFDSATGKEQWTCPRLGALVHANLLPVGKSLLAFSSHGGPVISLQPSANGGNNAQVTPLWQTKSDRSIIGSAVEHEGLFYYLTEAGFMECRDTETGNLVWEQRLQGPGHTALSWSSLIRSGDRLYALNQSGDTFVLKAGRAPEILATNSLAERVVASPAASGGLLFIRSYTHLWCIAAE